MGGEKMVLKVRKEKIHLDFSHLCPRVERTELQKERHQIFDKARLEPAKG